MSNAKLMTPLFYQGNYNTGGKKMRALMIREVSNGTDTYRLWRRDGKPDRQYPQGKGDDYILYVELHGYLATLRTTDYYLIDRCGYKAMVAALYGGEDKREQYFDGLRRSGGDEAVLEVLRQEEQKIQELGRDPAVRPTTSKPSWTAMYQLIWSLRRAAARPSRTTLGRWCWANSRAVWNCLLYIKVSAESGSKSVKPKLMRRTGRIVRSATGWPSSRCRTPFAPSGREVCSKMIPWSFTGAGMIPARAPSFYI